MSNDTTERSRSNGARPAAGSLTAVCRAAMDGIAALTGRTPDTVSSVEPTDGGWRVEVEVVDLERIPASTSILATSEVEVDGDGSVCGYRRVRRYFRNAAEGV